MRDLSNYLHNGKRYCGTLQRRAPLSPESARLQQQSAKKVGHTGQTSSSRKQTKRGNPAKLQMHKQRESSAEHAGDRRGNRRKKRAKETRHREKGSHPRTRNHKVPTQACSGPLPPFVPLWWDMLLDDCCVRLTSSIIFGAFCCERSNSSILFWSFSNLSAAEPCLALATVSSWIQFFILCCRSSHAADSVCWMPNPSSRKRRHACLRIWNLFSKQEFQSGPTRVPPRSPAQ